MALKLAGRYPGQTIANDPGYPHGAPRNATSVGDGNGFPLHADWVADVYGLLQSLLVSAGIDITENSGQGVPDRVGASQYLQALDALYYRRGLVDGFLAAEAAARLAAVNSLDARKVEAASARYRFAASGLETGALLTISATTFTDDSTFEVSGNSIIVKRSARYRLGVRGDMTSNSTGTNPLFGVVVRVDGGVGVDDTISVRAYRPTTSVGASAPLCGGDLLEVAAGQVITMIVAAAAPGETVSGSAIMLSIDQVTPPEEVAP